MFTHSKSIKKNIYKTSLKNYLKFVCLVYNIDIKKLL